MALGILSKKIGMTQVFDEDRAVGATVFEAEPCTVIGMRRTDTDGYNAIQLGYGEVDERKVSKPVLGQFRKAGVAPCRYLFEIQVEDPDEYDVGDKVGVDLFSVGDKVDVSGTSRGLGFQGVVKRWNFSGGPKTHGSHFHRRPGSVGQCVEPGRVVKGRKLPGQTGNCRSTIRGLTVLKVDAEKNLLVVKGSAPGPRGGVIEVRKSHG